MANFAKINEDGIVETVLVVADEQADNAQIFLAEELGLGGIWIESKLDGSIRYNAAIPGMTYDAENDAFIPVKPFDSWVLDAETFQWKAPVAQPEGFYDWDEESLTWVEFTPPAGYPATIEGSVE